MIRILQVGLKSNPGGMENCIMNYYRNINKDKYSFYFVDNYDEGLAYESEIIESGGVVYRLPNIKVDTIRNILGYYKLLKKGSFDIVHINMLSAANILTVIATIVFSCSKIIVHSHNSSLPSGLLRKLFHNVNVHILRMLKIEKFACGIKAGVWMWGKNFDQTKILYNAIDTTRFVKCKEIRRKIRECCGFVDKDIVLGFVGRLSEQKNPLFLIEVLKILSNRNNKYKLLIVGDGELKSALVNKANNLNILDSIYFAGVQEDTSIWYQAMDVFLLPSLFEGFPVVSIEAQAIGLPCFFSSSITDEVKLTNNVYFCDLKEKAEFWCNEIEKVLKSNNAIDLLPEAFDIKVATKSIEKVYSDIRFNGE